MEMTETKAYRPLLDIIVEASGVPCPDGLVYGFRSVYPDLRSRKGYRYPWSGQWAEAANDGRSLAPTGNACPSGTEGGLCIAKTAYGACLGGMKLGTALLVAYNPADVLGEDSDKLRVRRMFVLDVVATYGANLYGADLQRADLHGADLRGANLHGADLHGADLQRADLRSANLRGANLHGADLHGADLRSADLHGANLRSAYLEGANLSGADLSGANLSGANLSGANLRSANMQGANMRGAYLYSANLEGARASAYTIWPDGFDPSAAGVEA